MDGERTDHGLGEVEVEGPRGADRDCARRRLRTRYTTDNKKHEARSAARTHEDETVRRAPFMAETQTHMRSKANGHAKQGASDTTKEASATRLGEVGGVEGFAHDQRHLPRLDHRLPANACEREHEHTNNNQQQHDVDPHTTSNLVAHKLRHEQRKAYHSTRPLLKKSADCVHMSITPCVMVRAP